MSIVVIRQGLLTTIQDHGRAGYWHLGIRPSGVMDPVAAWVANLLVGNAQDEAVLEVTLLGPTLRFDNEAWIALAGADFQATLDGQPILNNAQHRISAGQTLELRQSIHGCRGYLAISGGFSVPSILGSRSTDIHSGWGGFEGRALQAGDVIPLSTGWPGTQRSEGPGPLPAGSTKWSVELPALMGWPGTQRSGGPGSLPQVQIPILRGSEADWFTRASWDALLRTPYTITPQSDRMGYRLSGEPLAPQKPRELLSSATLRGNIQVPSDGQPIVLLADHPTTGGYPVIATVATAAWSMLAQARPGDQLRFIETTRAEARQLLAAQGAALKKLACAIEMQRQT